MSKNLLTKLAALSFAALAVAVGCVEKGGEAVDEAVDEASAAVCVGGPERCPLPPSPTPNTTPTCTTPLVRCPPPPPPPPTPKPNLLPVTIDSNSGFCYGPNGDLLLRVRNSGNASAGASTTGVYFGSTSYHIATPALAAGASFDFAVALPQGCFHPDCGFSIVADEGGVVSEKSESDNSVGAACVGLGWRAPDRR